MTDLLDELRSHNPVDPSTLELPPGPPPVPRRRRRPPLVLVPVGGLLAACILIVVATLRDDAAPGLAERAYAAVSAPGIVHWRTDVTNTVNGRPTGGQRSEGWSAGDVTHVLDYTVTEGRARLVSDRRIVGDRQRMWIAADDDYLETPAPTVTPATPTAGSDPLKAFRDAYRAGRLTPAGTGRYRVVLTPRQAREMSMVYEIDPDTARPRRLVFTAHAPARGARPAQRWVSVLTFTVYETLPYSAQTRAQLELLAHPGAGPSDEPAARSFAMLRQGSPPAGAARGRLARLTRPMSRFEPDLDGARELRPDVWLVPGHGYLCVMTIAVTRTSLGGGGCRTIAQAERGGVVTGTGATIGDPSAGRRIVAVPDGVRAVRARRDGRWRTYAVERGAALVPGISGRLQLLR